MRSDQPTRTLLFTLASATSACALAVVLESAVASELSRRPSAQRDAFRSLDPSGTQVGMLGGGVRIVGYVDSRDGAKCSTVEKLPDRPGTIEWLIDFQGEYSPRQFRAYTPIGTVCYLQERVLGKMTAYPMQSSLSESDLPQHYREAAVALVCQEDLPGFEVDQWTSAPRTFTKTKWTVALCLLIAYMHSVATTALVVFTFSVWLQTLVRTRRLARGLCPNCGYAAYGVRKEKCPECGAVLDGHVH